MSRSFILGIIFFISYHSSLGNETKLPFDSTSGKVVYREEIMMETSDIKDKQFYAFEVIDKVLPGGSKPVYTTDKVEVKNRFMVYSKNFAGKTTKECYYKLSVSSTENGYLIEVKDIYFTTWLAPNKNRRGQWIKRNIEDVYPTRDKVKLEKKSYDQYIHQTDEYIKSLIESIKNGFLVVK
jgi:hypothetical protein